MKEKTKVVVLVVALIVTNVCWALLPSSHPWEPTTEKVPVRLAPQIGFHYGQHIVMDYFDLIEKYSPVPVDVTYTFISGGTAVTEAMVAGQIDFGSTGISPAVIAVDRRTGIKVLASMGSKEHMLWTWRSEIQSIEDIRPPCKVNVVKPKSIEEVGLIKAFKSIGRTEEDVAEVVVYLSHTDGLAAMELREIDCDFTGDPYNAMYDADPDYHRISGDSDIWGPLPGSLLLGTERFYNEHPDITAAVFSAWCEATYWIANNPENASNLIGEVYGYEDAWELWQKSTLTFNATYGLSIIKSFSDALYDLGLTSRRCTNEELMFPVTRGASGL